MLGSRAQKDEGFPGTEKRTETDRAPEKGSELRREMEGTGKGGGDREKLYKRKMERPARNPDL